MAKSVRSQTESPLGNGTSIEYTIADQQGTPAAVIAGSGDNIGKVVSRFQFDPYGRRINADGVPFSGTTGNLSDGIGGHEYDDEMGLVNMRGRIYDAGTRRFLSVDPYVSNPSMSQSYNPYSYAWNSPLSHSDPTGFFTTTTGTCTRPSGIGCDGGRNPIELTDPEEIVDLTHIVITGPPVAAWLPPTAAAAASRFFVGRAGAPPPDSW